MENRAYALAVGFFTLLLGLAAVGALWWVSGGGGDVTEYTIESPRSVTGLSRQAAVRFRGIRVGKVTEIDLDDTNPRQILVRIEVREDTPITYGTRARIGFQGISGLGHVQLEDDGSDPRPLLPVGGEAPRIAMHSGMMEQVTESGQQILARLRTVSEGMVRVMSPENLERIEKSLAHMASSAEYIEKTLAHAPGLIQDARRFSSPENAEQLREALANIQQATRQITPAVESFNRAMGRIEAAGNRVDQLGIAIEQGVAGETLPRVNLMVDELQQTATRLSRLLEELERSPQMLISGREATPLGPGERSGAAP